jgi:AbrB family looped-hinge helix DNA binding protein
MSLVKVRRAAQITLPAEARQKLGVAEGDYLEAEVVDDGVLLRPASVMAREKAWQQIREAQGAVRYVGPEPRPSPEEEEQMIFEEIEAFRHKK